MSQDNIRVVCRFRPPNDFEKEKSTLIDFDIAYNNQIKIVEPTHSKPINHKFNFDYVFDIDTEHQKVYDEVARPVVEGVFDGWNGSILAYGQTSSGKTFTMQGVLMKEELKGIVPRLVTEIFQFIDDSPENLEFIVKLSMLELYMEEVRDLLNPVSKKKIRIRQSPNKGVYLENLADVCVVDELDVNTYYNQGISNRSIGRTNMNAVSSRSHMITIINITQKDNLENNIKRGKLYLIDLAGSEKVGKTGASGQALEEAKLINKSLLQLGNVISALTEGQPFIPYRNSKLTKLLQESLGGNSRTTLIVTCSPAIYNLNETISTLRFGVRAKKVVNNAILNVELSKEQLIKNIEKAEEKINYLEGYNDFLKKHIKNTLNEQVPAYKHSSKQGKKEVVEKKRSMSGQINPEVLATFENQIKELQEKINVYEEEKISFQNKIAASQKENAVNVAKFQQLLEDYKALQIDNNHFKELLIQQEEANKQLQIDIENYEKLENEKNQNMNKVSENIEQDAIKNLQILEQFVENLSVSDKEKQILTRYMGKMTNQVESLTSQKEKMKQISKNLLENYQNLVEIELPQLEKNHQQLLEEVQEKERKKNLLCNEKIVELINSYLHKIDKQENEIIKKDQMFNGLKDRFSTYKKQARRKMLVMKNKVELLSKCVNIALQKYEDFKTKTVEHPHINLEVNFDKIDEFASNNFQTYNPVMENMNQGNKIIKMIRGKKKVDFHQEEDLDVDNDFQ